MVWFVTCASRQEADHLIDIAHSRGITLSRVGGLSRVLTCETDPSALEGIGVEFKVDTGGRAKTPDQSISLDVFFADGAWSLARIVRRSAPWNVNRLQHPISTFFRSVRDGAGVDIYTIDTGINVDHPEFGGRATNQYLPFGAVDNEHGSMVASAAAGETCGPARGALIWCFQWTNSDAGSPADFVTALGEALSHYQSRSDLDRPAVVALEISGSGTNSSCEAAVADCIDAGMVCIGAAGNAGSEISVSTDFPMCYDDVICVGASGAADLPAYFMRPSNNPGMTVTNYGARVDIMAPGQYQRGAVHTNITDYTLYGGSTSGALAVTVGVVACMLEGHSRLIGRTQVQAVKAALLANATTGRLTLPASFPMTVLPDRLLYLDPDQVAPETISGL